MKRLPEIVRAFLAALLGARRTDRLTVPPARQGRKDTPLIQATSRQIGGKSLRDEERLRAVQERAPAQVRQLYDLVILSPDEAAWFGPKKPDEARRLTIDRFTAIAQEALDALGDRRDERSIAKARAQIRDALPARGKDRPGSILRLVQRLNPDELDSFLQQLQAWLPVAGARSEWDVGSGVLHPLHQQDDRTDGKTISEQAWEATA